MWLRYPNPYSNHVISEDTMTRKVTQDKKLYSQRLLTKTSKIPKWAEWFMGKSAYSICVVEESIVDPKEQTITTYSRNIGLQTIMTVEEKCVYKRSMENKNWTVCERQAWVNSSMGYGMSYAIQAFGIERFRQSASKTVKGFEHVLNRMFTPDVERVSLFISADRVKEVTLKAKELAKARAGPVVASYTGRTAS